LVVNRYPQAIKTILNQDLGTIQWGTRVHQGEPMNLIKPDDVMNKL